MYNICVDDMYRDMKTFRHVDAVTGAQSSVPRSSGIKHLPTSCKRPSEPTASSHIAASDAEHSSFQGPHVQAFIQIMFNIC